MKKREKGPLSLIFNRRSVRQFAPGVVDDATVRQLLEAAMAAPSAVAKDPWRFVVVRERRILEGLAAHLSNGAMMLQAGLGIVVCGDIEVAHDRQLSYLLQDCSAATQNLLLAVQALGLGGCWLGIHPREPRMNAVSQMLNLPPSLIPVACVAVGQPAEQKEPRTRYRADYVHHDRW